VTSRSVIAPRDRSSKCAAVKSKFVTRRRATRP
jgi:hypothetical protein